MEILNQKLNEINTSRTLHSHSYQSHSIHVIFPGKQYTTSLQITNVCLYLWIETYGIQILLVLDSQLRLRFWKNLQYPTSWLLRTILYQCEWDELNLCCLFNYDVLMEIGSIWKLFVNLILLGLGTEFPARSTCHMSNDTMEGY